MSYQLPLILFEAELELYIFPHKARCSRGRRPRLCWISVKTIYWSVDFQERLFLFDPSLNSGMSAALMQGHCQRRWPDIKRHMSGGRECHRKYHRQLPPHLTNVADSGPTLIWHFLENLKYSISKSSSLPQ